MTQSRGSEKEISFVIKTSSDSPFFKKLTTFLRPFTKEIFWFQQACPTLTKLCPGRKTWGHHQCYRIQSGPLLGAKIYPNYGRLYYLIGWISNYCQLKMSRSAYYDYPILLQSAPTLAIDRSVGMSRCVYYDPTHTILSMASIFSRTRDPTLKAGTLPIESLLSVNFFNLELQGISPICYLGYLTYDELFNQKNP